MTRDNPHHGEPLTPRETEVLALIVVGKQNKEIARELGIAPRTVETHREHIKVKLGVRNAADMVRKVWLSGTEIRK